MYASVIYSYISNIFQSSVCTLQDYDIIVCLNMIDLNEKK